MKLAALSAEERRRGVIAMSAGNHAQAVAYHARRLSIPATIVMPVTTPFVKVKATEALGATVVLDGETVCRSAAARRGDRGGRRSRLGASLRRSDVIAGQGTIALEMLEEVPDLEVLVVPIGGGGLIAGCAIAAHARNPSIEIVGVEAALYPSMWNALHDGDPPCGGADACRRHRGEECRQADAADRARTGARHCAGRRAADRARGQRVPHAAENDGGRRGRGGACRHARRAGTVSRPQGRADPVRRQYRSADSRLDHGARTGARRPHRLVPPDHPRPAGHFGPDRHPARRVRRQHSRASSTTACSSTCRPRAPSSTSR